MTTHSGLRHMDALAGARVSIPTATILFWLLTPVADLAGWQGTAFWIFALVGLFFPAAVTVLTFAANRRLGPAVTGTVGSTAPLFAAAFLGEPLGLRELLATSLIVLGTVALSRQREARADERGGDALWLPWTAAALRALAQVLSKAALVLWPNPFTAALVGYTVSSAVVWAAALGRRNETVVFNRRGGAWFAATGVLNGGGVLALYCALDAGPVHIVSPIVATYPLFTLALSATLLRNEKLSAMLAGGVALTVAGVAVLLAR